MHLTLGTAAFGGVRASQAVFHALAFFPGLSAQDRLAGRLRHPRPNAGSRHEVVYPLEGTMAQAVSHLSLKQKVLKKHPKLLGTIFLKGDTMKRILIVGMNPNTVDFSKPGFEPGLTAEKVLLGIKIEREKLTELGYESDLYFIDTGVSDLTDFVGKLKSSKFDGVLIGAGVRISPVNFILFEKLVNTIHENAPGSKIIFNATPNDIVESVQRWL